MLKLIAWIIFFYLLFRLLRNVLGPMLGMSRRMQHPRNQNPYGQQQQYNQRKEGSTTFHKPNSFSADKKNEEDDGEYIDYKEIKE